MVFSRNTLVGYLYLTPLLLWLGLTIAYPLLSAVALSLYDVRIIGTEGPFVLFSQYTTVLGSSEFWNATLRSLAWVLGNGFVQTLAAFAAALLLKESFPGMRLARIWIILSWIVPTVVVVIIWRWMLNASGGIVQHTLMELNIVERPIGFFSTGSSAFASLIFINAWRMFPFITIILLAGLMRIPNELYEAAAVDGANAWQKFVHITLPGLQGVLFVIGLLGTLMSFNTFDVIWLMTSGGPSGGTTTLPVLIYDTAFKQYRLSRSAAMSVVTSVLLLIFALSFIRFMAPRNDEQEAL
jgi:multiple sugar transport system permease protein